MTVASELVDRLRKHYIKEPNPGGIFIAECGLNNSWGPQRRVDAVHVGFTKTSGQILRGHEIKVSRADWLHELDQPEKASTWADACHEWWLVTPEARIVHPGELPPGWGHMVPDPRAKVRFRNIVPAERRAPETHAVPWEIARSLLARMDTLNRGDRQSERREIEDAARERIQAEFDARQQRNDGLPFEIRRKVEVHDELVRLLGDDPDAWKTSRELLAAAALAPDVNRLVDNYSQGSLDQLAADLDATLTAVRGAAFTLHALARSRS